MDSRVTISIPSFFSWRPSARIAELGGELFRCRVQMVTLESTSDYWRIWVRHEVALPE